MQFDLFSAGGMSILLRCGERNDQNFLPCSMSIASACFSSRLLGIGRTQFNPLFSVWKSHDGKACRREASPVVLKIHRRLAARDFCEDVSVGSRAPGRLPCSTPAWSPATGSRQSSRSLRSGTSGNVPPTADEPVFQKTQYPFLW